MLAFEIEYLTGVVRAARGRGDAPDWPPQPDRLFSALVASWAARGEAPAERAALEWLERQPVAGIVASQGARPRTAHAVFVPPNDETSQRITILPAARRRNERVFPACIPEQPVAHIAWAARPQPSVARALGRLARDVSYLGHSASLVRCRLRLRPSVPPDLIPARVAPYPNRLADLVASHAARGRPPTGHHLAAHRAPTARPRSVFGEAWFVFRHDDGVRPDPVVAPLAAKTLLKAVQAGFGPDAAPDWVSGHEPDGRPLRHPHLAAVPLLDAGPRSASGMLLGLALVLPRDREACRPDLDGLALALARQLDALDRLTLRLGPLGVWRLRHDPLPADRRLDPALHVGPSRRWASVTPIALDRHPNDPEEAEAIVATACERIGLPRPSRIRLGAAPALRGAPHVFPRGAAGASRSWTLPTSLGRRYLRHATIEFAAPVLGPVLLGAGRFCGLGFCVPLGDPA